MQKNLMTSAADTYYQVLDRLRHLEGLGPLALRLYLGPIFIFAGLKKINGMEDVIRWFGNPEWGLGLPFPELMAWLAALTEFGGGVALIIGLGTRLFCIPLMVTMLVAAFAVHWEFGWQAVADPNYLYANERVMEAGERLERIKSILQEHGNYDWLTGRGRVVILNNGIEFAATYFIMCLVLLFTGGGRYFSVDYWLARMNGYIGRE